MKLYVHSELIVAETDGELKFLSLLFAALIIIYLIYDQSIQYFKYYLLVHFKIRLADIADTPALTSIFNSDTNIFGDGSTGFGENDIEEYILDKKKKVFVAEHEGQIIGALMADYHETYSHLETLIVEKTFHGKGIGSALMDHYEKDLEVLKIPLTEVMTKIDNHVMRKILVDRGFRKGNAFVFFSKGQ